ncbi:MAG: hypothetical protein QM734_02915 [Cyclobacteriaceae bacterium]
MKSKILNQKTKDTKHAIRYVQKFSINLPVEKIDLYQWLTEMEDTDYGSYSNAHVAMGSYFDDDVFNTVNVENIGNETLVQHYQMKYHAPDHVQLYSDKTIAYVMRWFPAVVSVPWEMQVRATSANTSELICLIGADFPSGFLKFAAKMNEFNGFFLKRHLKEEGKAFAADIENKFK